MRRSKRRHPYLWGGIFSILLTGYTAFTLLDAFVIPKNVISMEEAYASGETRLASGKAEARDEDTEESTSRTEEEQVQDSEATGENETGQASSQETVITENSYISDDIKITITEMTVNDTQVYVADVYVTDSSSLQSGLAENSFGQNVSEQTSEIAEEVNAILAINGDYYGFRSSGYVMRNGYLYRTKSAGSDQEDLVVYEDGSMEVINESEITAEELAENGAVQIYSFGPGLVEDGEITVSTNEEVDRSKSSNPRTAIGYISEGHYVMVVSDGRTDESEGLTLYELAEVMQDLGCTVAYNLDGGGSSTMWFNGETVNNPVGGRGSSERSVSDIVYIG